MIDFNINNTVYVKLTDAGRVALKNEHNALNKKCNGLMGDYKPIPEDSDGWSKWQMRELMNRLGEHCYNGCNPPFEATIRIAD